MIIIIAVVIIEHGIRIGSVSNRTRNTRSVLMCVIGPGLVKLPSAFGHIAPSMPGSVYLLRPRIGGYHDRLAQTFASDTLQRHWRITWAFFHRADVKALAHYPRRIELPMSGPTFVFGDVEGKLDVLLLPCRRRSEG